MHFSFWKRLHRSWQSLFQIPVNPLIAKKIGLDFFCLIFTITWNINKVSLQNYATALPHQRGQKCRRTRSPTMPTRLQACDFGRFSKSGQNLPLLWGKKKEQRFTSRYLHETDIRGLGTLYLLFFQEPQYSLHASASQKAHHFSALLPNFFCYAKKTYLNGNFPKKLRQSRATPKDVICY